MEMQHFFQANKKLWNAKTSYHVDSEFYNVAAFRNGACSLNSVEVEALGDLTGKKVLHLQCHFGMDSISLAKRGAEVVGVDISDEAITQARSLASELGANARFVCCNVYDLKEHLDEKFDIVFTSYGVIGWLPDLDIWAGIIEHFLAPKGLFYMVEFHPVVWMMDYDFSKIDYSYFNSGVIEEENEGTYADKEADIKLKEYSWNHSISETIQALLNKGLSLKELQEYDYSPYPCFSQIEEFEKGKWRVKHLGNKIPMMYAIKAEKNTL